MNISYNTKEELAFLITGGKKGEYMQGYRLFTEQLDN